MSSEFILVPGPPVRASSWEPTATHLREAGYRVQVPDLLAHHDSPPAWSAWTQRLLDHITPTSEPVVVGHSSASALAADLATRLPARSVIIVDGDIPPPRGAASPVRPALREFIRSLADATGTLPVWSKWHSGNAQRSSVIGLDLLAADPTAFAQFKMDFRKCGSIGSMTRSSSPAGIMCLPVTSRLRTSTITQCWKHSGVDGPLRDCTVRISIPLSVRRRLRRQFFQCRVDLESARPPANPAAARGRSARNP
jgi:pimeloyl-ACP methyl ester carboxylesterase